MKTIFKFLVLNVLALSSAIAAYHQAPPSFPYQDAQAVFVDFKTATHDITYDLAQKTVMVETVIEFVSSYTGYPIFDLVADPTEAILDGNVILTEAISDPDQQTTLRVMKALVSKGTHELRIKHAITSNVVWGEEGGVASGFWTSDLNDRRYMEQYLPTNLEFDQIQIKMKVNIIGTNESHLIKANGKVERITDNSYEINFPNFYTASSVYFHLFPEKNLGNNIQFYYPSIDGRLIPVDIYTPFNAEEFASSTKTILAELENDYGPFPHDQIIIYGAYEKGGMEYSGATITALSALGHELFHSYHARGLMPANGNAGWMDEAIARWRDNNYPFLEKLDYESTQLAGHSIWTRKTDRMAYKEGSAFLSWIGKRMGEKGISMKKFLRDWFHRHKFTTVTTQMFEQEMMEASGMNLSTEFSQYIYGKTTTQGGIKSLRMKSHLEEDPNHPVLTEQQLKDVTWL